MILKTDMIRQDFRKTVTKCPAIAASSLFVRSIWGCVDIGMASPSLRLVLSEKNFLRLVLFVVYGSNWLVGSHAGVCSLSTSVSFHVSFILLFLALS